MKGYILIIMQVTINGVLRVKFIWNKGWNVYNNLKALPIRSLVYKIAHECTGLGL